MAQALLKKAIGILPLVTVYLLAKFDFEAFLLAKMMNPFVKREVQCVVKRPVTYVAIAEHWCAHNVIRSLSTTQCFEGIQRSLSVLAPGLLSLGGLECALRAPGYPYAARNWRQPGAGSRA